MTAWKPIDENTPRDRRILVRNPVGIVHCANWSKSTDTGDEAWRVSAWYGDYGEFNCLLLPHAHEWTEIPE